MKKRRMFHTFWILTFLMSIVQTTYAGGIGNVGNFYYDEVIDNIKVIGKNGDTGGKTYKNGGRSGTQATQKVNNYSLCGQGISVGEEIRNIQLTSAGGVAIGVTTSNLDELKKALGNTLGTLAYNALTYNAKLIDKDSKGKKINPYLTAKVRTPCGTTFEIIGYDVPSKLEGFQYAEVTIEVVNLWNPQRKDIDGSNYQGATCLKDGAGNNATPLGYNIPNVQKLAGSNGVTFYKFKTTDVNYRKKYAFGCAGLYKATYTEYYKSGNTKVSSENIEVPLKTIVGMPEPSKSVNNNSSLKILQ